MIHRRTGAPGSRRNYAGRIRHVAGVAVLGVAALSAASCKGGGGSEECLSTRTYFEQQVWSGFMGSTCTKCHTPDGTAVADSNAKLVLETSQYPGFIDANLSTLTTVAN